MEKIYNLMDESINKLNKVKEKLTMGEKLTVQDLAMFIGCECLFTDDDKDCWNEKLTPEILFYNEDDPYKLKPILRPLSDITDEELKQLDYFGDKLGYSAQGYKYLISKHFDVFEWIEKGLAIDKTKK